MFSLRSLARRRYSLISDTELLGAFGEEMGLLSDIQKSLMDGADIGPILLKLRFLASRLGSDILEEWVRHEAEGYPGSAELPSYRKIAISYIGDFSGPFGSGIRNAPIPPYLIGKFAGKNWTSYHMRQSISGIEALVSGDHDGHLAINAADLIIILQGKVYEDYACNSVRGNISTASLVEIQSAVRNRVLELTIAIERSVPGASEIDPGSGSKSSQSDADKVTNITNQVIHGNYTAISNSGSGSTFSLNISQGSVAELEKALADGGISPSDAADIAKIVAEEKPDIDGQPFGKKAREWLSGNVGKALNGTWKVGMDVATQVLTNAAKKYYGLE